MNDEMREMPAQFRDMVKTLRRAREEAMRENVVPGLLALQLRTLYEAARQQHAFAPGDLVQWKDGLKNRLRPDYGQPAVVIELLAEPVFSTSDEDLGSGSPDFHTPHGIVLGIMCDGQLLCYHYESWRFEPYTGDGA